MPKVLCTLPNASEEISGVKFTKHANGMLSDEISDERAADFASIPGYEIVGEKAATKPADDGGERTALEAKAAELGLAVKGNWGNDRLKAEIERAEKAKAAGDNK